MREHLIARCAIDKRAFFQFDGDVFQVIAHEPHAKREIDCTIANDEGDRVIQHSQLLEHDVDGDDYRDWREHSLRNQPERDVIILHGTSKTATNSLDNDDKSNNSDDERQGTT